MPEMYLCQNVAVHIPRRQDLCAEMFLAEMPGSEMPGAGMPSAEIICFPGNITHRLLNRWTDIFILP